MINERECCGTFEGTPHRTTCRSNLLKEISRLKAELSEAKSVINDLTGRHGMQTGDMSGNSFEWRTKYMIIERQLAEARAEVESIGYKPIAVIKEEARQSAAEECIEAIEAEYGILGLAYTLRQRFGLEG